jgi:putative peptidoglycan lipid II flippase
MLSTLAKMPGLRYTSFRWRRSFDLRDPGLRRVGMLLLPAIVGVGAGELNTLVDRILASGLSAGSVSALNYANRLMQLAPTVIGSSVVTVVYPALAKMAAKHDRKGLTEALSSSLGLIHFMLVPIAVGVFVLREPLIRIAFERGSFDAAATQETAWALLFLSLGIAAFTMRSLVDRAFFAMQDTTTPVKLGVVVVITNIVLNLLLVGPLRQGGLALATSVSSFEGLVAGLVVFRRKSSVGFPARRLLSTVARTGFASAVMGVVVWVVYHKAQLLMSWRGSIVELVPVGLVVALGAAVYLLMAWILRVPELSLVSGVARRGLRGVSSRLIGR